MRELPEPRYLFLDLETTGLDPHRDQVTECAWKDDAGRSFHRFVDHSVPPTQWVLDKTDYLTRIKSAAKKIPQTLFIAYLQNTCDMLKAEHGGNAQVYLVGANPTFDDSFICELTAGYRPYNYHLICIETVVLGYLLGKGLPVPKKERVPRTLKTLRSLVGIEGENPEPHTAQADADEVKLIWDHINK